MSHAHRATGAAAALHGGSGDVSMCIVDVHDRCELTGRRNTIDTVGAGA